MSRVPIAIILTLLFQIASFGYFAGQLSSRVGTLEDSIAATGRRGETDGNRALAFASRMERRALQASKKELVEVGDLSSTPDTRKQVSVCEAARVWTTFYHLSKALGLKPSGPMPEYPFSLPLHVTCRPGTRYLNGTRSLNPNFSELVMGWPIGWSDTMAPVTGFAPWLRRMRGALSRLLCEQAIDAETGECIRIVKKY